MKTNKQVYILLGACLVFLATNKISIAAPVQGGSAVYEFFNSFDAVLVPDPNNPFNPGPDPIPVTFVSNGILRSSWEDQVGSTIAFEHTGFVANGELPTDPPTPFQIVGGIEETPALGSFDGELTSVVNDGGDPSSLIEAFSFGEGQFGQLIAGAFLYSASPYSFEATVTGLPYPVGTEFVNNSSSPVDVLLQLGSTPDPAVDLKVAEAQPGGIVRITRIVPEPASYCIVAFAVCVGTVVFRPHRVRI